MKKAIIFIVVSLFIIAILVGVSLSNNKNNGQNTSDNTQINSEQSLPWIEVVVGKIFELEVDMVTVKGEFATGDSVLEGMVLKSDLLGKAVIHYPEGSELRLEKETIIKIEKGSFDTQNDSLKVRVELVVGRVWSKIIELATPDSEWEVKTANAVATVRGTAFGMESDKKKKTKIIGSENNVQIGIRNAKNNISEKTDLMVVKDKVVEITDEAAGKLLSLKKSGEEIISSSTLRQFITERSTSVSDLQDGWIKDAQSKDDLIRQRVDTLKRSNTNKQDFRNKLREDARKVLRDKLEQAKDLKVENDVIDKSADSPIQKPIQNEIIPIKEVDSVPAPLDLSKASLEITTKATKLDVTEGEELQYLAFLVMSDGTRKDVTTSVKWNVIGYIGVIDSSGRLITKILPEATEYELVLGSVEAIFTDSRVSIKGLSKLITVHQKIIDPVISPQDISS